MDRKSLLRAGLPAATLLAAVVASPAQAVSVTFDYTESFGSVSPGGMAPWATAVIDDGNTAGSVTLTMTLAAGTVGEITGMYFNLLDDSQLTLDGLNFMYDVSSTGPEANNIVTTTDFNRADGDGFYDILFDFPPPPGNDRFEPGEVVIYEIMGAGLTANDFNVFGAPGPGAGNPGPFLSVARFQETPGGGSDWVGAIPVPAAVWLFGSGLLGLVGVARRKRS